MKTRQKKFTKAFFIACTCFIVFQAIMVAKLVGDQLTHPIYHALLEVKCIPILDEEPVVYTADKDGKSVL